ncbi:MAG: nucleotidyltransferase family protein [Massilia sp.]|nr:nucleotidyltransferase family protein [Massilia sp.]
MTTTGILLAAGRGRRFDPSGERNKLLEQVAGVPVAVASATAILAVLPRVIAVVGPDDGGVAEALRAAGCDVVVCVNAGDGMGSSLAHAIRHSLPGAGAGAWLIALADMPHVAPSTIAALCAAIDAGAGIAAPVLGGRRGNPVAFSALYLPALLALEGDQGARAIVRDNAWTAVQVDDAGIFHDIDTPSDLHKTVTLSVSGQAETP